MLKTSEVTKALENMYIVIALKNKISLLLTCKAQTLAIGKTCPLLEKVVKTIVQV